MKNTIYLRRQRKIIVANGHSELPKVYLATSLKNLEVYGFTFSKILIERVQTLSVDQFTDLYFDVIQDIKEMIGANVQHKPMYVNFPQQVMEMSEVDMYIDNIIHFLGLVAREVTGDDRYIEESLPQHEKKERFPLLDNVDLKVIDLGTEEEFDQMMKNLIQARTSISDTDKKDIDWAIEHEENISTIMPNDIPLKENVGFVVSSLLKHEKASVEDVSKFVKTATDVLRLATALSEGDVSLATNTKFKKFKRAERRLLLGLLNAASNRTEDMLRFKNRWIRLGEILHPSEYKNRYPKAHEAFQTLRSNEKVLTFGGKVETALLTKDLDTAISLLKNRPGDFARRLDHLLRHANHEVVLKTFAEIVGEVSTNVLLQVMAHFKNRTSGKEIRAFFPKGNVQKVVTVENQLPLLSEETCQSVVGIVQESLVRRMSQLSPLGKVYLEPKLKQFFVPFAMRSASKSLKTVTRGSRIAFGEGNTIRTFLYWKEGEVNGNHTGTVDIDLSVVFYDGNWNHRELISFHNRRSDQFNAVHSGDIRSAPRGASEFIDIDIEKALENGARYVVLSINSFSHQPYCDLPECFAGWMMRKNPESGEIYEPTTVQDKFDLASDTEVSIPVIVDLEKREVIWTDLALKSQPQFANTAYGNRKGMADMGKALATLVKPNLYDLFYIHAVARGELVEDKNEAETIFSLEEGITPFDYEKIIGEFIV